jgi:TonB-dependent SusC/RagA subfamily outer membrane receptor
MNEKMKIRILTFIFFAVCFPLVAVCQKTETKSKKKIHLSGIVTDANGKPIAGAMILIDKKNTNSVTDNRGFFKVKIRTDADLITVFTLNNELEETQIEGRTTINFVMNKTGSAQKDKQDISTSNKTTYKGSKSAESKDFTSSTNKIDANDKKYASYSDIYQMLQGAVPGVRVIGKSIEIQGVTSFKLSNEPLFVVNGMVVPSIDDIHPVEVKSIEVLKGPAASAYGVRGANGVIVIYLKDGSK